MLYSNPADCCGCTACVSICPKHAITMKPDALGFLYPEVDKRKCTNCGRCENVCAFNDNYEKSQNLQPPLTYGVRHKALNQVMRSRSGAAFAAISDYILDNGGIVYGAGYSDHFRVIHKRATSQVERDDFRGSKYVQSDMGDVFLQVKNDLQKGLFVLFSGTPCQTSGLNSFVGKRLRENLLLIDVVCHGVPSPYIWRDYLNYIEKKQCSIISKVDFREKSIYGWTDHKETFKMADGNDEWQTNEIETSSMWKTWYTHKFYQHIMFRHSCGNCHFCNMTRPADITLADFWGWQKQDPTFNLDDRGANLVLINTDKGKSYFEKVRKNLVIIRAEEKNFMQPNLQHPSIIHSKRMQFEKDYVRKGFDYIYSHDYDKPSAFQWLIYVIKVTIYRLIHIA